MITVNIHEAKTKLSSFRLLLEILFSTSLPSFGFTTKIDLTLIKSRVK